MESTNRALVGLEEEAPTCDVVVKIEPEWDEADEDEVAVAAGLYAARNVKQELVIGPELIQKHDIVCNMPNSQTEKEEKLTSIKPAGEAEHGKTCSEQQEEGQQDSNISTDYIILEPLSYQHRLLLTCVNCGKITKYLSHLTPKPLYAGGISYSCCSRSKNAETPSINPEKDEKKKKPRSNNPLPKKFTLKLPLAIQKTKIQIRKREQTLTGENRYCCDVCKRWFGSRYSLVAHVRRHTGEKPYKCDTCDKRFSLSCNLTRHKRIHTDDKPHSCPICNKCFSDRSSLTRHKWTHTGEKPYCCDVCNMHFTQNSHLAKHKMIHTGEKPYSCSECGKRFTCQSDLNAHLRRHTGEKRYQCEICMKRFADKTNLLIHHRLHTNEKPFCCDICNKQYISENSLNKHKRLHTGEKLHSCETCGKLFANPSDVIRHVRVHTGQKPFVCSVCQRCFTHKSTLTRHLQTHAT